MNRQVALPKRESYSEVVSAIHKTEGSMISVPDLSTLLGVKTTTLNARFRRENIAVRTVGRTNFIPHELALRLAELHKYALFGWPTLRQASQRTGVKSATIKARCELGKLEGHIDLTKRLRIDPAALESFELNPREKSPLRDKNGRSEVCRPDTPVAPGILPDYRKTGAATNKVRFSRPPQIPIEEPARASDRPSFARADSYAVKVSMAPGLSVARPAEPRVRIITSKDYGLPDLEEPAPAEIATGRRLGKKPQKSRCLEYDPERPFSVSDCAVGRRVRYAGWDGTILQVFADPFNPQIKVAFPDHQHPLMREVILIVGRKRE